LEVIRTSLSLRERARVRGVDKKLEALNPKPET
jgi:hypothetical protein